MPSEDEERIYWSLPEVTAAAVRGLKVVGTVREDDVPGIRISLHEKWIADLDGELAANFIASCSAALGEAMGRAEAIAAARRASPATVTATPSRNR